MPQNPRMPAHGQRTRHPAAPHGQRMPQGPQAPHGSQGFRRLPDQGAWRPGDPHPAPGSPSGYPAQPPDRPGAAQPWHPGPPVQASHNPGDGYDERGPYGEPGPYSEPDPYPGSGEYENEEQGRFLPGFGDAGYGDEYADAEYEEDGRGRGRTAQPPPAP